MLDQVGAVDCDSQDKFCKEQEIQQFPKLLIYPLRAGGRAKPVPYNGDWTIKAVKKFINQQFSPFTITLTHENFVEVMSKDQERPLAILVRKTKDHPVSWVALCAEFEKRVDCYDTKVRTLSFSYFILNHHCLTKRDFVIRAVRNTLSLQVSLWV